LGVHPIDGTARTIGVAHKNRAVSKKERPLWGARFRIGPDHGFVAINRSV